LDCDERGWSAKTLREREARDWFMRGLAMVFVGFAAFVGREKD
jgi:threonine/homoserine/homoserine lactone efflux protein